MYKPGGDARIGVHGVRPRIVLGETEHDPIAEVEERVADVAAVLHHRPHVGLRADLQGRIVGRQHLAKPLGHLEQPARISSGRIAAHSNPQTSHTSCV